MNSARALDGEILQSSNYILQKEFTYTCNVPSSQYNNGFLSHALLRDLILYMYIFKGLGVQL